MRQQVDASVHLVRGLFFGVLAFCTFVIFMVFVGWPAIMLAAEKEAMARHMKQCIIGISKADKNCLEWRDPQNDSRWICVRR